jgi:hypothetical protein
VSVPLHSVALHLGALHPYEQMLVLAIAFGPFVVLAIVVYVGRRRAIAEEAADEPHTVVEVRTK